MKNNLRKKYQICTKCIMDTSDPEITFDENGVCNWCGIYERNKRFIYTENDLIEKVKQIKEAGKGKKYDCIMGVSGGVDSCMTAYTAKKFGLRPLAVHLDNGWNSEISQSNIERTLKKLDIDLYTHVIDWEEFKDLQIAFLKASVSNIDYPYDHAIVALFYEQATKYGLKYVLHGGNIRTEGIMPKSWGYVSWDLKHLKVIHKRFGKIRKLKTYPTISLARFVYNSLIEKIQRIPILNYVNYDKQQAKEFLMKEFGWQDYGGKHCESIYTRFFVGYVLPKKFGFDRNRAWLSALVLSGQMKRDVALEEMKKGFYSSPKEMEDDKNYVIKKLGLTDEEFKKIMANPVKEHKEYPNNSLFYENWVPLFSFIKRLIVK